MCRKSAINRQAGKVGHPGEPARMRCSCHDGLGADYPLELFVWEPLGNGQASSILNQETWSLVQT